MEYVLDTSALIDAWTKWYGPETTPAFWDRLERLAKSDAITIPDAVFWELEQQSDDLYRWCSERRDIFCTETTDDIQTLVTQLATKYPNLRGSGAPSKNLADPIVIAVAQHFDCAVVTHENAKGNLQGPRIPDVCRNEQIRVMQIHHLVKEQKWIFR